MISRAAFDGVKPLHHALPPDAVEFAVEGGGLSHKIVRQVGASEVFQVDCPKRPAQTLRAGQLLPGLKVPEELRPPFGEVAALCCVLPEELPLVFPVRHRFPVFRLLQALQIFLQVNLRHRPAPSPLPGPAHHAARPPAPGAA